MPDPTPTNTTGNGAQESFSKEQLEAAIEKARKEEKEKLYKNLEEAKKTAAEKEQAAKTAAEEKAKLEEKQKSFESEQKKLAEEKAALQKQVDDLKVKAGEATETEAVKKQMAVLEAEVKAAKEREVTLKKQIDAVADAGAQRVAEAELARYREQKIRESGIKLTELVTGKNAQEIDASIAAAQGREKEIREAAEKATEEKLRKEFAGSVPGPRSPSASMSGLDGRSRMDVAKLNDAEYKKIRAQLLEKAKATVNGA